LNMLIRRVVYRELRSFSPGEVNDDAAPDKLNWLQENVAKNHETPQRQSP
jgi:hypothetical protein